MGEWLIYNLYTIAENLKTEYETRDPFKIAKGLGAIIVYVPLVHVGGFYQRYKDRDIIYINQDLSEEEQLLYCAHELGHMILHKNINSIFLDTDLHVEGIYELEANVFAIQLLQDDLNLNREIPILNWSVSNYALKRRVYFTQKA